MIAAENGISEEDVMMLEREDFMVSMLISHNCTTSDEWIKLVSTIKMSSLPLCLTTFLAYVKDFIFFMMAAGEDTKPLAKKITKIFINGLSNKVWKSEIIAKDPTTLVSAIRMAQEMIPILGLSIASQLKDLDVSE